MIKKDVDLGVHIGSAEDLCDLCKFRTKNYLNFSTATQDDIVNFIVCSDCVIELPKDLTGHE